MNRKFTLLELLIVIAIIGILVSILMPSLASAREKARIAVCLSNHSQMAKAYSIYASKNNQVAVAHSKGATFIGIDGYSAWMRTLPRRLNEYAHPEVARCPSDKGFLGSRWDATKYETTGNSYYSTGGADTGDSISTVDTSTSLEGNIGPLKIFVTSFDYPDKKIMFYNKSIRNANSVPWLDERRPTASWHSLKFFMYPTSYIDGHASYVRYQWKEVRAKYNGKSAEWKRENLGYY